MPFSIWTLYFSWREAPVGFVDIDNALYTRSKDYAHSELHSEVPLQRHRDIKQKFGTVLERAPNSEAAKK